MKPTAEAIASVLTEVQLKTLVAGLEQGSLLLSIEGEAYLARLDKGLGWWVYKLDPGSPEYLVTDTTCSCPAEPKPCKHITAVKYGTGSAAWARPMKSKQQRKKHRGPR